VFHADTEWRIAMAEALKNRVGEVELIDLMDGNALEHWSAQFGVSVDELQRAVRETGSRVADVRAYFENRANRIR
jgi:molybdenum cofactor biosynthesis enzyme MoaA